MKLKGINAVEQHLEKIVLGVVALVFLAALAVQFLLQPNAVEVGGSDTRPPGEIYDVLAQQAQRIEGQLEAPNPALPDVATVDLIAEYERSVNSGEPATELAGVFGGGLESAVDSAIAEGFSGAGGIGTLTPPAPHTPVAHAQWLTLDPFAVATNPELAAIAPSQQPYDVPTISIEATFDGTELSRALTNPADGRAIPRKLWAQTGVAVLRVEVERQARTENGGWGEAVVVERFPGAYDPVADMAEDADLGDLVEIVRTAKERAGDVMRPTFPPTISGQPWAPPSEAAARDAAAANQDEIERLEARIARLEEQLDRSPRSTRRPSGRDSGGRDSGERGRPAPAPQPSRNTNQNDSSREDRVREEIEKLRERIVELSGEGQDESGTRRASRSSSLLDDPEAKVWVHDATAEPGAAYRYRVRVAVNNPLYNQGALLDADGAAADASSDALAWSDWSDWSEPVLLGAEQYVFVTSAQESTPDGGEGRASLEVYTMYYGFYRRESFSVQPGEPIRRTIGLPDGLALVDTDSASRSSVDEWLRARRTAAENEGAPDADASPSGVRLADPRLPFDTGLIALDLFSPLATGGEESSGRTSLAVRRPDGSVEVFTPAGEDEWRLLASLSAAVGERTLPGFAQMEREDQRPQPGERDPRAPWGPGDRPIPNPDRDPGGGKRPSGP